MTTYIHDQLVSLSRHHSITDLSGNVDTSLWTTRLTNIVKRQLTQKAYTCGMKTMELVTHLSGHHLPKMKINYWTVLREEHVKPEKWDEMLKWTAAWIRLLPKPNFRQNQFMIQIRNGEIPGSVPLNPTLSHKKLYEFYEPYLRELTNAQKNKNKQLLEWIDRQAKIKISF